MAENLLGLCSFRGEADMSKKVMVMEGCALPYTENGGDVGNTRLRTAFTFKKDRVVYLELERTADNRIQVTHCYIIDEKVRDSITQEERRKMKADLYFAWEEKWKKRQHEIEGLTDIEWSKAEILEFINKTFNLKFTDLYAANHGEYNVHADKRGHYINMETCPAVFRYEGIQLDGQSYKDVSRQIFREQVWFNEADIYYYIWMFPMEVHPVYPNNKETIKVFVDVQTYTDSVGPNELKVEIVERKG